MALINRPSNTPAAPVAPQRTPVPPVAPTPPKPAETPAVPMQSVAPKQESKPAGFSAEFLAAPITLAGDSELAKITAPRNQRSEEQIAMDNTVKALHSKWVAAGRPSQWPVMASKGCVATYPSKPENTAKLKQYINRGAALHDLAIKWGTTILVTEEFIRKQTARGVQIPQQYLGCEMISFAVKDKRERKDNTATAEAATGQSRPESR